MPRPPAQGVVGSSSRTLARSGLLGALVLLALPLSAGAEVSGTGGLRSLGTRVNGREGGSCGAGLCGISGGMRSGPNLFHRFDRFDTRGAITGVRFDTYGLRNVMVGVIDPLGSRLDKAIRLSAPANLFWLSPGGMRLGDGASFANVQRLTLTTATGLRFREGVFDVLGSSAAQVAALGGEPVGGQAGLVSSAATLQGIGLTAEGDLSIGGGLLTVDNGLLLDARGGNVLLEGGGLQTPVSIEVAGANVLQAAPLLADGPRGGSVRVAATGNLQSSAPLRASGSAGPGGTLALSAGGALVQTAGARLEADGTEGGGTIALQAGTTLFSSATASARGTAAGALGGTIEVTAPALTLAAARLDAGGAGGGGAVRVGGGFRGVPLQLGGANADRVVINPAAELRADGGGSGLTGPDEGGPASGGEVVVWSERATEFRGTASARGAARGGDGGRIEVSGRDTLLFGGMAEASAPGGQPGQLLLDPKTIVIDAAGGGGGSVYSALELADPNPGAGQQFAGDVKVLASGDVVATDPDDNLFGTASGAVYLFDGSSGSLRSTLTGTAAGDRVGSGGVTLLGNGNVVVSSPEWGSAEAFLAGIGAVTWQSGTAPGGGSVGSANSLVGSAAGDRVGSGGVTALGNGNYVVSSPDWGTGDSFFNGLGAVTWGDGGTGVSGEVSVANSLVGAAAGDRVGSGGVTALTNGHYVVASPSWASAGEFLLGRGAVTWADGGTGLAGTLGAANSLLGAEVGDLVGSGGVTALSNGNFVVSSPAWGSGAAFLAGKGAVTWADGTLPLTGSPDASNSLVGTQAGDGVGSGGVTALRNGNYVVSSPSWRNGVIDQAGAVTWGRGATDAPRTIGPVTAEGSLVGENGNDRLGGGGVTALANGNYVVSSPDWNGGTGAATLGDGALGRTGTVDATNSLVGAANNDVLSSGGITALSNGNYVVRSPDWGGDGGFLSGRGAVTWGDGDAGVVGVAGTANSLVGAAFGDRVGSGGVTALTNGNYVVSSPDWSDEGVPAAGAVTWADGATGRTGTVFAGNSLVGGATGDRVGSGGVTALGNGNYVVSSPEWGSAGSITQGLGAVTWGSGGSGRVGPVDAANSLVGTRSGDLVGQGPGNDCEGFCSRTAITEVGGGGVVVASSFVRTGGDAAIGAVTWLDAASGRLLDGTAGGGVGAANSLFGPIVFSSPGIPDDAFFGSGGIAAGLGDRFLINSPRVTQVVGDSFLPNAGSLQLARPFPSPGDLPNPFTFATFPGASVTVTPAQIAAIANTGTSVELQASTDIALAAGSPIVFTGQEGTPGGLTLRAGRSISLASPISTGGGDLLLSANDPGALPAYRDEGPGGVAMLEGSSIDAGGGSVTIRARGGEGAPAAGLIDLKDITAGSIEARGDGGIRVSGANLSATGGALTLIGFGPDAPESRGVYVDVSTLTTAAGTLHIEGTGGRATDPGGLSRGIEMNRFVTLQSTGGGSIELIGTGGSGGSDSIGVALASLFPGNASSIRTTGDGAIAITGFGGAGGAGLNQGVHLTGEFRLATQGGSIGLTGFGGTAPEALNNEGIYLSAFTSPQALVSSGGGAIRLEGTARAGSGVQGALLTQESGNASPLLDAGRGSVSILGQEGSPLTLAAPVVGSTIRVRSLGAEAGRAAITLDAGASLTATDASGDSLVLDAGAGAFRNNAGADVLSVSAPARWLVFSGTPLNDDRGGLPFAFKQYGMTFLDDTPILGQGNGVLYAITPTISPVLSGAAISKVYDGTTAAAFVDGNAYIIGNASDYIDGDQLIGFQWLPSETAYTSAGTGVGIKDVGTGKTVEATIVELIIRDGEAPVYGYGFTPGIFTGDVGVITPKALTISGLSASNKVYDGTTAAAFSGGVLSGVVSGDEGSVLLGGGSGAFDTKNVGVGKTVTISGLVLEGSESGNYLLEGGGVGTALADITAKALTVSGLSASNKVYDGTTAAAFSGGVLSGVVSGDEGSVLLGGGSGAFDTKNVGVGKTVTISGLVLEGSESGNYVLEGGGVGTALADITIRPFSTWTSSSAGLWSDAARWDVLPETGNVAAVLIPAGSGTATFDAAAGPLDLQLLRNAGTLVIDGPGLRPAAFDNQGTLTLNRTLTLTGPYTQSAGALLGGGTLRLEGSGHSWSGGRWGGGGAVELAPGAALAIGGGTIWEGRALRVEGEGGGLPAASLTIRGVTTAAAGDNPILQQGTLRLDGGSLATGGGSFLLTNTGSLLSQGPSSLAGTFLQSAGSVRVEDGALELLGDGSDTGGSLQVANGAELVWGGGSRTLAAGTPYETEGTGRFRLAGATLTATTPLAFGGNLRLESGSLRGTGGSLAVTGGFFQNGGEITGFRLVALTQTSGDLEIEAGRIVGDAGDFRLRSSAGALRLSNATLDARGTAAAGRIDLYGSSSISLLNTDLLTSLPAPTATAPSGDGGTITVGTSGSLPGSVSIVNSRLVADPPPARGGTIAVNGSTIEVRGSTLNVLGRTGGAFTIGSRDTRSLSLDGFTTVILGPDVLDPLFLVGPGGLLRNDARLLYPLGRNGGAPPSPPPPPSPPTPSPGPDPVGLLGIPVFSTLSQPPINDPQLASTPAQVAALRFLPGWDPLLGTLVEVSLESGSFRVPGGVSAAAAAVEGRGGSPVAPGRAPGQERGMAVLTAPQARETFQQGEREAQQATAAKLGLAGGGQEAPSTEQVQGLLQRVMEWVRAGDDKVCPPDRPEPCE